MGGGEFEIVMAAKKKPKKARQKLAGFKWDERRTKAAQLVAEGQKTNEEIAKACGVARQTFDLWNADKTFSARVQQIVQATAAALLKDGIRVKENRVSNLQSRVDKMLALIEARGVEMKDEIAGGETGLLVRDYKGKDADIPVYKFDAAVVKELREHEKQAAIELGQWTEKREHKVDVTAPITIIEAVKPHGVN